MLQVDFQSSTDMHRTVVNSGVDAELDQMKRTYDGIEDLLNRSSQSIAASIPLQYSLDLNVIFFPQIGFLISMPIEPAKGQPTFEGGEMDGQIWDRIFSTGTRVYYKDFRMRELDDTLGDMYAAICGKWCVVLSGRDQADYATLGDKEIEIIHELSQRILKDERILEHASDICGDLDW